MAGWPGDASFPAKAACTAHPCCILSLTPPRLGGVHGGPQVRVTRGKLASGSVVERPAVLTQRKWDRPSAGACLRLCVPTIPPRC